MGNSDDYEVNVHHKYKDRDKLTPAERGVHRRRLGIVMLVFSMFYGTYGLLYSKELNEIYISTIIAVGGGLLGIGKVTKDVGE